jgi:hypothetical protein
MGHRFRVLRKEHRRLDLPHPFRLTAVCRWNAYIGQPLLPDELLFRAQHERSVGNTRPGNSRKPALVGEREIGGLEPDRRTAANTRNRSAVLVMKGSPVRSRASALKIRLHCLERSCAENRPDWVMR